MTLITQRTSSRRIVRRFFPSFRRHLFSFSRAGRTMKSRQTLRKVSLPKFLHQTNKTLGRRLRAGSHRLCSLPPRSSACLLSGVRYRSLIEPLTRIAFTRGAAARRKHPSRRFYPLARSRNGERQRRRREPVSDVALLIYFGLSASRNPI